MKRLNEFDSGILFQIFLDSDMIDESDKVVDRPILDNLVRKMLMDDMFTLEHKDEDVFYGRTLVSDSYCLFISPDLQKDFEDIPGFILREHLIKAYKRESSPINEIGIIGNLRICLLNLLKCRDEYYKLYDCICVGGPSGEEYSPEKDFKILLIKKSE